MITLSWPLWLLLLLPAAALLWQFRLRGPSSRWLFVLRTLVTVLLIVAMCGPAIRLPSRAGTVVVVVDRSLSMPPGAEAAEKEIIDLVQKPMSAQDRLAVVTFGQRAAVERTPDVGKFSGFVQDVEPEASNLADGLNAAMTLLPRDAPGRVLVISDGRWTGRDPAQAAARAAGSQIAIDYRQLSRPTANDLAIVRVSSPPSVAPGQSFVVTAWVQSPVAQEITFEFRRGDTVLATGSRSIPAGLSRLLMRDRADASGTQAYLLTVRGKDAAVSAATSAPAGTPGPSPGAGVAPGADPVPENNIARVLVGIEAPRRLLVVSSTDHSALADLLQAGGLAIERATPAACEWSLPRLSNYSGVVLEDVPANDITQRGMETLATYVREAGCGLMITGGRNSYGPGGYYKSPLEPVMPVSMELRREHRKLALDVVVALDRSGSMSLPAGAGRVKMDLANLGTVAVMDLLAPMDELGVIAVDSAPHTIADLAPVTNKEAIRSRVLHINSEGGGIYIYEALKASAAMIAKGTAGTRHIILFADAADSEEPGAYADLVDKLHAAGVTVSVIGLGTDHDSDAHLLQDIARRGGGRIFFSADAAELPRLFAQDTFVVARSAFITEATPVRLTPDLSTLAGRTFDSPPGVGGYNLCYLRPESSLGAVSLDEYKAPIVASWQAGLGRVLCYTGEADGKNTGAIAGWHDVGEFFTSLARWTAGESRRLPGNMLVTQEVHSGNLVVRLHLDPDTDLAQLSSPPKVTILRARGAAPPSVQKLTMEWTGADALTAEIPLIGSETAMATVHLPSGATGSSASGGAGGASGGTQPVMNLAPVCPPIRPVLPADPHAGLAALRSLSAATGGLDRTDLAGIWKDLPRRPRSMPLTPWLIVLAMVLLLAEVLERRTGMLSMVRVPHRWRPTLRGFRRAARPAPTGAPGAPADESGVATSSGRHRPGAPPPSTAGATAPAPSAPGNSSAPGSPVLDDALRQARRRAEQRTKSP